MTTAENKTREEREQIPLGSFVYDDRLPLPIRDYLNRYLNGGVLPYSDSFDETMYSDTEMRVAVLADHLRTNDPLPEAAVDFVKEYLYRLEEAADVHIWNDPDVLRVAYPIMITFTSESAGLIINGSDAVSTAAVKTALHRLCTRRELMEFYERHGIEDKYRGREELAGSAPVDLEHTETAAFKLARVLAAPRTPRKTREAIELGLREFSMSSGVTVEHPALAARAYTLMCEAKPRGKGTRSKKEMDRDKRQLLALLEALPDGEGGGE